MSDNTTQESTEAVIDDGIVIGADSEQGQISGDIFDNHDDDDSIDMEALSKLVPEKVEKSPIELEAEKIEKELDPENEGFDPLKALEAEIAKNRILQKKTKRTSRIRHLRIKIK